MIRTIPYKAWQAKSFYTLKALEKKIIKLIEDRLKKGVFKYYYRSYRNLFFLVIKKNPREYRIVNTAIKINRVTIRDANLPPLLDNFSKEFTGIYILSLID